MKRQKQHVYPLLKYAMIGLVFFHVFFPLTTASSNADPVLISSRVDSEHPLNQESQPILPEWDAPLDPDSEHNLLVTYDQTTRTAETHSPYPVCKTCIADATDYQKPYESPGSNLNEDPDTNLTRSEITQNPDMWPNAPTVRITAVWPSGDTSACSGMLVEKAHVLTAAHCIFTHTPDLCLGKEACWVEDLQIYSNINPGDDQPTSFSKILAWTSWTENRDFDGDIAAVALTSPIGEETGWLGFGYHNDPLDTFFPAANLEYTSYPTQSPFDGETMSTWMGQFTTISELKFYSTGLSQEGQSGAGTHNPDANHIIFSVLSHTLTTDSESNTGHTRITSDKFFAIRDWINWGFKDLPFQHFLPIIIQ